MLDLDLAQLLIDHSNFRCTPGHCIIRLERKSPTQGSIVIPDTARDLHPGASPSGGATDIGCFGAVLAMTPRKCAHCNGSSFESCGYCLATGQFQEDFRTGDRIWLLLLMEDLDQDCILTSNTRVYALAPAPVTVPTSTRTKARSTHP